MRVVEVVRLAILLVDNVGGWQTVKRKTVKKCRLLSKHLTPAC